MLSVNEAIKQYTAVAPVNIESLIRDLGVLLDKKAVLDEEISGQLERLDDGTHKISVNKDHHYYRRRFSMAHELGHYLLHLHLVGEGVDDNKAFRSEPDGNFYNVRITSEHETEANKFAADILTPEPLVRSSWAELNGDIKAMSRQFQVSETAMNIRVRSLGL